MVLTKTDKSQKINNVTLSFVLSEMVILIETRAYRKKSVILTNQ